MKKILHNMCALPVLSVFVLHLCIPLKAAAPVVHAYLAQRYFELQKSQYTEKQKQTFMIGTLFPDIRYLARIPRTKTHFKNVSLKKISETKDPFEAGMLFHTYVDEQRENVAQKEKIYNELAFIPKKYQGHFLKVVEDELCYGKYQQKSVLDALKTFDKKQEQYGIPHYTVRAWHKHLKNYLRQSPLELFKQCKERKKGYFKMTPQMVSHWCSMIEDFAHKPSIKGYVNKLLEKFEALLVK